jgi:hypothetical protein
MSASGPEPKVGYWRDPDASQRSGYLGIEVDDALELSEQLEI